MSYIREIAQATAATGGYINVFPQPIEEDRAPTANDQGLPGLVWTYKAGNAIYMYSGNAWLDITNTGGPGVFTSLTVTPGALNYTGIGSGFTMTSDTASSIGVTGAGIDLTLDSAAGQLILTGGEAAANAVRIQADNAAGGIDVDSGTGGFDVDTTGIVSLTSSLAATLEAVVIEASAADSGVAIKAGSQGISIGDQANCANITIGNVSPLPASRTITIGGATLALDGVDETVNLARGNVSADGAESIVRTVHIANGDVSAINNVGASANNIVNIASGDISDDATGTVSNIVNIATGENTYTNVASQNTVNILTGEADALSPSQLFIGDQVGGDTEIKASGTISVNLNIDKNVAINTGTSTGTVTIGNAAAGAITLDSGAGISIDGATASNFTSSLAASAAAVTISASAADSGITLDAGATPGVTITNGTQSAQWLVGTGSPNGAVSASQGSIFLNVAGTADTILYVNTDGATAWTALTST